MNCIKKFIKKNHVASSFIIYFIGTVLLQGINFITTPIFTRILSTNEYGITSIFNTWVAIFAVFIGCQVTGSIATARVHKSAEQLDNYMKSIMVLSLIGAAIISSLCILFRYRLTTLLQIDVKLIPHLLIQAYGTSCAILYSTYTIQTKKPKKNVIFSIIVTMCTVVLSLILILSFQQNKYLGKIYSGTFIYIFVIIYISKRFIYNQKTKIDLLDWKYCLVLGAPLIIHLLSNIVIGQSDRVFIKNMLGNEKAAIYSVSYSIGSLGMIFADVCNNVWAPWYLDNTKANNSKNINNVAQKYVILVSGGFALVMLMAPEVIRIMAPKEYLKGVNSLLIIIVSVFFQYLYRFPLAYEQYRKNMKWVAFCTVTSALINMGLNYVLINLVGMFGAALATLISYIILFAMHEFVARKIIKGFNINVLAYVPGIVICLIFLPISYFALNYWYIRYSIILVIIIMAVFIMLYIIKHKKDSTINYM